MHGSIGDIAVDAERPLIARSSIAQFACRILEETRKRGQFMTSSEVLDRKEFRTPLDEYRKVKQDPDRVRESREMKSRLIELHSAICSPRSFPSSRALRVRNRSRRQQ